MKIHLCHYVLAAIWIIFLSLILLGWQYLPDNIQPYFHGRLSLLTFFIIVLITDGLLHYGGSLFEEEKSKQNKAEP